MTELNCSEKQVLKPGLILREPEGAFYDRFANPMESVQQLGKIIAKSAMVGCDTEYEGAMVAFQCLAEKVTPLEFGRKYHVIKGKITKKAVVQCAEFRALGGRYKLLNNGEDGIEASAEFVYEGEKTTWSYTYEEAKKAGLGVKAGSNWDKNRPAMLRARLFTKAFTVICPEIVGGFAPEGIDEDIEASTGSTAAVPTRTPEQVAARAAELRAAAEKAEGAKSASGDVIDAEYTAANESAAPEVEAAPFSEPSKAALAADAAKAAKADESSKPTTKPAAAVESEKKPAYTTGDGTKVGTDQLKEMAILCEKLGVTLAEFAKRTCEECKVPKIQDLTWAQASKLIMNMQKQVTEKK